MDRHGQFRINSDINITGQITTECKSQRRDSSLINKISNFPVVTLSKYVFLYLSRYRSNSNLGKERRRFFKQGRSLVVATAESFPVVIPENYILILS